MVTVAVEKTTVNQRSFIAVIEDIRQLKQVRVELQQRATELERVNSLLALTNALLKKQNEELDQFAYVSSHDLKAPLRAISNLSEWIEEDVGDQLPDDNRHQLSLLRNRVHRMENLINGLLRYSRAGRRESLVEAVDVNELLQEVVASITVPEGFHIKWSIDLPILHTNRVALSQVFANLIGNGIKHHDRSNGQILITAEEQKDLIEFAVVDDGPGIEPTYHEKVFTIFQTLRARDDFESTGIGLSIVKKIVDAEGGTIALESDLGAGATFRFTWPKTP
jgi:light-regulated signal transduction histidine kinase (bacteriophytochrome)